MPSLKPNSTFKEVADVLISDTEAEVKLGLKRSNLLRDYKVRARRHCEPFFSSTPIRKIDHRKLKEFVRHLAEKELKATSILAIMSFVSVTLKLAVDEGCIQTMPRIPRPSYKDCPRPAFSRRQYVHLLSTMRQVEKGQPAINFKSAVVDRQLRWAVTFMVQAFLRPGDLAVVRHKHIEVVDQPGGQRFVRLHLPPSKGHSDPIITMPAGVPIYQRLLAAQRRAGFGKPDDFLFHPDRNNRRYAFEILRRQFAKVLDVAGLRTHVSGAGHSLYSLRHYAITQRLVNSDGLDLLTIARNARTSVEMIDRFYASSLRAEMNIEKLHSFRRPSRYSDENIRREKELTLEPA